jgi:hypothetical protein
VTSSRDTVTRSGAVTVTPQQKFRRSDLHEGVGEKKTDSLCLLIVVGGQGAFVTAFRNRAEIVLAHVNRQSPKSAALPFPQGSHSLGRCRHGGFPPSGGWCTQNRSQGVNGPLGAPRTGTGIGGTFTGSRSRLFSRTRTDGRFGSASRLATYQVKLRVRRVEARKCAGHGAVMQEIADWLTRLGLPEYARAFAENGIDVSVLPHLTDQDLKDIGVLLGHRRKMLAAIAQLPPSATLEPAHRSEPKAQDTAERRQVTVMFADLVGSTALSARMDPEDLREVISGYQKCVAETVQRFGGFVAKYMGDGVLVTSGIRKPMRMMPSARYGRGWS